MRVPSDYSTRNVLVTGAASGIGQSIAIAFGTAGATVMITDVEPMSSTQAILDAKGIEYFSVLSDVSSEISVVQMVRDCVARVGRVDAAVNCAGILKHEPLITTSADDFDKVISVNLRGTFLFGREVLKHMCTVGAGRLINIASDLSFVGREEFSAYCASKAGVLSLTRTWALEFAPDVLVNAICPGPIDTAMLGAASMSPEWRQKEMNIPLKRFGKATEVAAMALFLAGPGATFITGQSFGVNGGSVMH